MPEQMKTFTLVDPRTLDGDPFEVAERSVLQAAALAKLLEETIADAYVMARNAELERQIIAGESLDAEGYASSPQGRRLKALEETALAAATSLAALATAAGYNPKRPLNASS